MNFQFVFQDSFVLHSNCPRHWKGMTTPTASFCMQSAWYSSAVGNMTGRGSVRDFRKNPTKRIIPVYRYFEIIQRPGSKFFLKISLQAKAEVRYTIYQSTWSHISEGNSVYYHLLLGLPVPVHEYDIKDLWLNVIYNQHVLISSHNLRAVHLALAYPSDWVV